MKLFICLLCIGCIINTNISFASAIVHPIADQPGLTKGSNSLKASEFVKLSAKDFRLATGKKMNLWDRLSFSILKMRIKHDLKKNPNLAIADYYPKKGRHLGVVWIVLICIGGLVCIFFLIAIIGLSKLQ